MDKDIAIKVQNVSKVFKIPHEKVSSLRGAFTHALTRSGKSEEFKALDDVSFEVKKGEFFGIIGRNGSGKSTLLKILAGIYQPNTGKIHIDGMIAPFLELGIGFNPELSGRDNVYLNATVLGMTQKQIDKKFDDIVKFSELERFIDQKLKNYSSGMQVRLAFSVSIHANRDILLMDEVLAVGDSNFQSKCLTEFAKYKDMGRTVVIVTHDIGVVQRYCDRAILLRSGKIMKIGNAEEVGNEYVYENMSDEEKRIIEEEKDKIIQAEKELKDLRGKELAEEKARIALEKKQQEEERKNKVAEIIKVDFLDKDGEVKNVFGAGDDVSIRVYFKLYKTAKDLNFGISLFTQENDYIFGGNTILDRIDGERYREKGYFEVVYNNVPLHSSTYYIKAGIFGSDDSVRYDFLEKSKEFKIYSKSKNPGLVEFNYGWK
jgi:ABC-type polysaccharide/polyol phosphate transport system ATPase subunit